jgi:hypothetical protein
MDRADTLVTRLFLFPLYLSFFHFFLFLFLNLLFLPFYSLFSSPVVLSLQVRAPSFLPQRRRARSTVSSRSRAWSTGASPAWTQKVLRACCCFVVFVKSKRAMRRREGKTEEYPKTRGRISPHVCFEEKKKERESFREEEEEEGGRGFPTAHNSHSLTPQ